MVAEGMDDRAGNPPMGDDGFVLGASVGLERGVGEKNAVESTIAVPPMPVNR